MRQRELGEFLAMFGISLEALEGSAKPARARPSGGRRLTLRSMGFGRRARVGLAATAEGTPFVLVRVAESRLDVAILGLIESPYMVCVTS